MTERQELAPLISALADLARWFEAANIRGIVVGGVAASLIGRPRLTHDVDALVMADESRWQDLLERGAPFGFRPRLTDALAFAARTRALLMRHEPTGVDVDIMFGALRFEEEAVAHRSFVSVAGVALPLPTPEDLIVMKAVAHRPRDLTDIEAILDVHPGLDVERVRRWVREFARAAAMPEIWDDLQRLLKDREERRD
ncbi:MAG: hypothetical protein A3E57_08885 [Candidatus Muproteobacteria bacterium RIFCSPHIGHO2_12_FULL_60_33]|uniref:DUF6036 domain-containing protein n=1 Tax=Candidatus Muproteobacteria bacterium RIFCSPLOWO2_01_FULL_60_18 TaxID=1817768 RepID=A0A1F6U3N2_9PROT|nr:MAG: hypothetical protein A3A87_08155 [Candidatus Muproteobacteria bacterium RIFCSPLOWO2_01_FULL_60_18]OGI53245.1 MAG: hypothetical protein A2W42_02030 [Candidatus Muproteobacteria bacterium RIFCSPHIGHO2_01_60_12]OGI54254.1 MAG: hypothetical protein A3D32_06345 [Candidatus Muproteobacteria bacterium RIFCSPHIGHO2_02_FULL_60_13]OGI55547.1 MAG: hypothetical protein A3E57_08885 [Candidatus Muproteobacteria bacterium RIFCSPHIGHO2_12_FULL_60_33]OGI58523.1 MAG: hypothetical protein A2809_01525 [Can